jgi:hypothetical protein
MASGGKNSIATLQKKIQTFVGDFAILTSTAYSA